MSSYSEAEKERVSDLVVRAVPVAHSLSWARAQSVPHDLLVGCLKSLQAAQVLELEQKEEVHQSLTPEGEQVAAQGAPEYVLWAALPPLGQGTRPRTALLELLGEERLKIALGQAMKEKWVALEKADGSLRRVAAAVEDGVAAALKQVQQGAALPEALAQALKKRQLLTTSKVAVYAVSKGVRWSVTEWRKREATELTAEMLQSGAWKDQSFKPYNFNALGAPTHGGHLHPLMKVRAEFREIFLELGYAEMPTNAFVESSFWNFDALFQPQSHPARDAHDTFFLTAPATTLQIPQDYLARVKRMHEEGGQGSIGWRYTWSEAEARKNILRTHTTAVSSRMLYLLAQQAQGFTPKKYFSIDRVYRNETLDATHLAEFHQIEGLVADYNLTLADLVGSIKQFFARYGIKQLKFKPAYNPYTEPSMEIFGYHPGLKRWVEIGNSGMFRPEMLLPMGLPEGVRVIAWGLSLERPTMIKYGLNNIRQLVGHKVDLSFIADSPICRFDQDEAH